MADIKLKVNLDEPADRFEYMTDSEYEAEWERQRERLKRRVAKHGDHDQSSHGNWAHGTVVVNLPGSRDVDAMFYAPGNATAFAFDKDGRRVGWLNVLVNPFAKEMNVLSVNVEAEVQYHGLATQMAEELHDKVDMTLVHGSFASDQGLDWARWMVDQHPSWNRIREGEERVMGDQPDSPEVQEAVARWHDAIAKHTPGGVDHDQSTHGSWAQDTVGGQTVSFPKTQEATAEAMHRAIVAYDEVRARYGIEPKYDLVVDEVEDHISVTAPEELKASDHARFEEAGTVFLAEEGMERWFSRFGEPTLLAARNSPDNAMPAEFAGLVASFVEGTITLYGWGEFDSTSSVFGEPVPIWGKASTPGWAGLLGSLRHEYGHQVANILAEPARPAMDGVAYGLSGDEVRSTFAELANVPLEEGTFGTEISQYATSSAHEAFAEVFAVANHPNYDGFKGRFSPSVREVLEWTRGLVPMTVPGEQGTQEVLF